MRSGTTLLRRDVKVGGNSMFSLIEKAPKSAHAINISEWKPDYADKISDLKFVLSRSSFLFLHVE